MEHNEELKPETNLIHTNTAPSESEQSSEQQEPAINKVDESEEPLTDKDKPGWRHRDNS